MPLVWLLLTLLNSLSEIVWGIWSTPTSPVPRLATPLEGGTQAEPPCERKQLSSSRSSQDVQIFLKCFRVLLKGLGWNKSQTLLSCKTSKQAPRLQRQMSGGRGCGDPNCTRCSARSPVTCGHTRHSRYARVQGLRCRPTTVLAPVITTG